MKIYFTCSTAEFQKYHETYFAIRDFLITEGHILTRDWLPKVDRRIKETKSDLPDIKQIYDDCMKGIQTADLVIIEDSVSNFSTGHQITVALQQNKPTLVLWSGEKHTHFNQMFIHGIESEYLQVATYGDQEYREIIKEFTTMYSNPHQKSRFHLVLSEAERTYLDWLNHTHSQSRTEAIRSSIRDKMKRDKDYRSYLQNI
ncbi:hypothetical protein KC717_04265 [Candidatus Dojkabacteria bacterium]|uniref:Nucleoside 2-deoxyribosyltransferase n=1 Tax=Candidatus Dojkabacteria bacterium TaxID=2099670 RepID=A0A955L8V2_9BACT|nr:hypothetical protein [Candidatus Dojkabacteria bacterium]